MNTLIKPKRLQRGDKIAMVTLSWGGPGAFPYLYEIAKQRLRDIFDLDLVPMKHALKSPEWIYNNPQARAQDLMDAFINPEIKGIFSSIGGDDSIRILPYIDYSVITNNPKVFLGFSDTTVSHFICYTAGIRSFYGPAIMTAFAENVAMHEATVDNLKKTLFEIDPIGDLSAPKEGWTKELLDWENPENQSMKRILHPPLPWKRLGPSNSTVQGRLIGGCVEVLQCINGTELWPKLEQWKSKILFLETSEENLSPEALLLFLRNLAAQGILQVINGLLFSKPGGTEILEDQFREYDQVLLKAFEEFMIPYIPIVTHMDFGHTDPMLTLPYDCLVEISHGGTNLIRFLEGCVS